METREEYQLRIEFKLRELEPKIWMLKQRAEGMRDEAKAEYYELFRVLQAKLGQVQEHLTELEEAGEETWQDLTARIDGALADLNNSVGNILSRMG